MDRASARGFVIPDYCRIARRLSSNAARYGMVDCALDGSLYLSQADKRMVFVNGECHTL
jgi:hypothetical protein